MQSVYLAPEQCPLDPVWLQNPTYRFPHTPDLSSINSHTVTAETQLCVCWLERWWEDRWLTAETVVEQHCGQRRAEAKMEERERLRLQFNVTLMESAPRLSPLQNHSYSHRSEELKREIRFHVAKRRNNSYQTQPSVDQREQLGFIITPTLKWLQLPMVGCLSSVQLKFMFRSVTAIVSQET